MVFRLLVLLSVFSAGAYAQSDQIWMHPNRGQWDNRIQYKVEINSGELLLEKSGFTYQFYNQTDHHNDKNEVVNVGHNKVHAIKSTFIGSQSPSHVIERKPSTFYRNYFLSNNRNTWKSNIHSVSEVISKNIYSGIDVHYSTSKDNLKYSWIVAPNVDPSVISWKYEGANGVLIDAEGNLEIKHEFGSIYESKPIAWTIKDGKKSPVRLAYFLTGTEVHFVFDGKSIFSDTLIIDPSITFSTFTGSTSDNWGFTATPDVNGNLFAAGIVFGGGYPTTIGVYDASFDGGEFDVGITKFNATGTSLLYSTYLGGSGNETPHSINVNSLTGELFVMGVTSSSNFPMAGASFDNSFGGGPSLSNVNGLNFNGSDLYIARFSADGSALVASTYLGGSNTDGLNQGVLNYNYGDSFRGEIIVSGTDVYIASSTNSLDFPVVNASQVIYAGNQDAVLVKINENLSSIAWSTFLGGSAADAGNALQIGTNGSVYIAGGTASSLSFTAGNDVSNNGGQSDGYIYQLNSLTGAQISSTYFGTSLYDQNYFVQLNNNNEVFVLGQSSGSIPITAGKYGNANSGFYLAKYSSNLASLLWTTSIGAGTGDIEISPTAFLVSNCGDIYISGWGGEVNSSNSAYATQSSSNGFPVTSDAYQAATNGNNFWIAVLGLDATSLKYATYMGGTTASFNHVDGGTSRFDKNGNIYHAVCGACGGNNFGFTTTPGVWSPSNPSPNCNLAAFKFELSSIEATIGSVDPLICLPDPVVFQNNSANGNLFEWDFGDGTTSNLVNPTHVYPGPGVYTVQLIVSDTLDCFSSDSLEFQVNIGDFQGGVIDPDVLICSGDSVQVEAFGGANYSWSPPQFVSDPLIPNPFISVTTTTVFSCIISDSCGVDTLEVTVNVVNPSIQITADTSLCLGSSMQLEVQGVVSASWSPATFLSDPNSLTPISTPDTTITYVVVGFSPEGCELTGDVEIVVFYDPPIPILADSVAYCAGLSAEVTASGAEFYSWSPTNNISPTDDSIVVISTQTAQYYYCLFENACGFAEDSIWAYINVPNVVAGNDTIICPGERAFLFSSGAVTYTWFPNGNPLNADNNFLEVFPNQSTRYSVIGIDEFGCIDTAFVQVDLFTAPTVFATVNSLPNLGDPVQLNANTNPGGGSISWSPVEFLSCITCQTTFAQPDQNFTYFVEYTDLNGCKATDEVSIIYPPLIYVPNAFTPDGDENNNEFFALGSNINTFQLEIYNRWGELIYTGDALDKAWDGTYAGLKCPDGVYVWKILYSDFVGEQYQIVGHVNLLR